MVAWAGVKILCCYWVGAAGGVPHSVFVVPKDASEAFSAVEQTSVNSLSTRTISLIKSCSWRVFLKTKSYRHWSKKSTDERRISGYLLVSAHRYNTRHNLVVEYLGAIIVRVLKHRRVNVKHCGFLVDSEWNNRLFGAVGVREHFLAEKGRRFYLIEIDLLRVADKLNVRWVLVLLGKAVKGVIPCAVDFITKDGYVFCGQFEDTVIG